VSKKARLCKICKTSVSIPGSDLCKECAEFTHDNGSNIKSVKVDRGLLSDIVDSFVDIDVVKWCEKHVQLPDSDRAFKINGCGREYLIEPMTYITSDALQRDGSPVVILKGRQVGMSVTITSLYLYLMASGLYDSLRVLHAFPGLLATSDFHKTKVEPMIMKSEYIRRRRYTRETMGFDESSKRVFAKPKLVGTWTDHLKAFQSNNMLTINATAKDAGRLRGQTFHIILFDEVQDMTRKAIENVEESLTTSPYGPPGLGVRVYFGTPFLEGSNFHNLWESSDQRYYHPRCHTCGKTYQFYTYGSDDWEKIWIESFLFKCPHCGAIEDKREAMKDGEWVPTKPDATKRGYHFNQLYTPTIPKEAIMMKKNDKLPQQFKNEVLGEFYGGILSSESYRELVLSCTDEDESYVDYIEPYVHPVVSIGVDWGGKVEEQSLDGSWTVALVMTEEDGKFYVRHMERIETKNPEEQINRVKQLFSKYSIVQGVGDMGYGQDKIWSLQSEYGKRFMGCHSVPSKNIYNYNEKAIPPFISINKDMVIDEVLSLFRSHRIVLPYKNEKDQLLTEILTTEISAIMPTERIVGGARIRSYMQRGSQTIDSLMALIYAYVAVRFSISNGFTNMQSHGYNNNRSMPLPRKFYSVDEASLLRLKDSSSRALRRKR